MNKAVFIGAAVVGAVVGGFLGRALVKSLPDTFSVPLPFGKAVHAKRRTK